MKSIFESFIFGTLAALLALVIETVFAMFFLEKMEFFHYESLESLAFSYSGIFLLFSAITEETAKLIIVSKKIKLFSKTKKAVILNSLVAGIGFSVIEIILLQSKYNLSLGNDYLEIIKLMIFHSSTFAIIGYFFVTIKPIRRFFISVILPLSFAHFSYNLLALCSQEYSDYARIFLLLTLVSIVVVIFFNPKSKLANS